MTQHLVKLLIDRKLLSFFSKNTRAKIKHDIQALLGARIIEDCKKYLGLPMVGLKSKVNTFKDLWEKVTNSVMG